MRRILALVLLAGGAAPAHVGSPDVFFDGTVGPYPVFVTVRTPGVIPGVAEIEIRCPADDVTAIRLTPTPLSGPGAKFAPTPDLAQRSALDKRFYTGSLWMMSSGSWQVKVQVEGERGSHALAVPVPALARRTAEMQRGLGAVLFGLMLFLAIGVVSIVGAATREGKVAPGLAPPPENERRARIAMGVTAVLVAGILYLGNNWWTAEAKVYARILYKPLAMKTSVAGGTLKLELEHTGWFQPREFDSFVPDHGHLMHLFVVSRPDLDRIWHLHPRMTGNGVFEQALPRMPAGRYRLYADLVQRNGLPETVVAEIELPATAGRPLRGDDTAGTPEPLAGGYEMIWDKPALPIRARESLSLRFRLVDLSGAPAKGMELYLGMPGHAAILKKDGSVFAHIHPTGSAPMAALEMAQRNVAPDDPHALHRMHSSGVPHEVSFPYGFPESGEYRIYVQMKRAGWVETGMFDVTVERARP